jgi:hypothetical protein
MNGVSYEWMAFFIFEFFKTMNPTLNLKGVEEY